MPSSVVRFITFFLLCYDSQFITEKDTALHVRLLVVGIDERIEEGVTLVIDYGKGVHCSIHALAIDGTVTAHLLGLHREYRPVVILFFLARTEGHQGHQGHDK